MKTESDLGPSRFANESPDEKLAWLATCAIDRSDAIALRRLLIEGLNPNALACDRQWILPQSKSPVGAPMHLIDRAVAHQDQACFDALDKAGGRLTEHGIARALMQSFETGMAPRLLAKRTFHPLDIAPTLGCSWMDWVANNWPSRAEFLRKAVCELEALDVGATLPNPAQWTRRRAL